MPIRTKIEKTKNNFIFFQKDILVRLSNEGAALPALPDHDFFKGFVTREKEQDNVSDVIYEIPQDYSAAKIKNADAAHIPNGYQFIPLREFCFLRKDDSNAARLPLRAKGILFWHDTYRHCPKCGSLFTEDKAETALLCTNSSCAFKLYPRIEPCVIVLVHKGDEILLVKNVPPRDKFFSCIAGFMELGESAKEAAEREVREEVGIEITNIREAGTQSWPFPDQLMIAFHADYSSGNIVLQKEEIQEARWFKAKDIPQKEEIPGRGSVAWNLIFGNK